MKKLAILGYHKIGDPPRGGWHTWNYISAETFEKQLKYIYNRGWEVIDVNRFLRGLDNPDTLPPKTTLITFDDGYRSNLNIALPILKKFCFPAIIFVPTAFIGSYNAFDADIFHEPKEDICTWEELLELEFNGISIQSHSVTHRHFSHLTEEEQLTELKESKNILEKKLNTMVDLFSFPYGDYGLDEFQIAQKLTESGYKAACLYGGKFFDPMNIPRFQLGRIAMGPDTNIDRELSIS